MTMAVKYGVPEAAPKSEPDVVPAAYVYTAGQKIPPKHQHFGAEVRVGPYKIFAGGASSLIPQDLESYDLLVPLLDSPMPFGFRGQYDILALPLQDFGGVPPDWREGVEDVIRELKDGWRVLTFCHGGHGRTGTLLSSLVALLESDSETPDPIAAVRLRYCEKAVETLAQATAIFALRGMALPEHWRLAFTPKPVKFVQPAVAKAQPKNKKKNWFFGSFKRDSLV